MRRPWEISRRAILRGTGTMIGLPFLEAMIPGEKRARAAGVNKRLIYFVFAGGTPDTRPIYGPSTKETKPGSFRPLTGGRDYEITPILQPLADLKQDMSIVSGVHNAIGVVGTGPSAGLDHSRSAQALLTGCNPQYSDLPNHTAGISVDQLAANTLKQFTPGLPSLFLGSNEEFNSVYSLGWAGTSAPLFPTVKPSDAFRKVFGDGTTTDPKLLKKRLAYRQGILHHAKDDADRLRKKLGKIDQTRLDEYLTNVASLEQQIAASGSSSSGSCSAAGMAPDDTLPFPDRLKQMMDLTILAMQCDRTRVATIYLMVHGIHFNWLGSPLIDYGNYHDDVEHGVVSAGEMGFDDVPARAQAYLDAVTWMVGQFGYLIRKMKGTLESDGSGTMLDNSMCVCTSEISYGNGHSMHQLPVILAGRGGGAVTQGRHLMVPEQPIANLWLSMLQSTGINVANFGNSTGPLSLT